MTKNEFLIDPRPVGQQIADRCKNAGVSVNEVCRRAGVPSYHVTKWKKHTPSGLTILSKIETELQKVEGGEK